MKPLELLVVDDEEDVRQMIGELLRHEGYQVTTVAGGVEALAAARGMSCALATVDLRMPGMDGKETIAALRRLDPSIALIVLSAFVTPEDDRVCRQLGAFAVLRKPFDVTRFLDTITAALENKRPRSASL